MPGNTKFAVVAVFPPRLSRSSEKNLFFAHCDLTDSQVIENPARGLPALEHRGYDQIRAAHHVPAGEHLRMRGLKRPRGRGRYAHAAVGSHADVVAVEPARRTRQETEGDDDRIRRHDLLRAGDDLRHAPPAPVRLPESRRHQLHTLDPFRAHDLDRLSVEQELHALLAAVTVVAP